MGPLHSRVFTNRISLTFVFLCLCLSGCSTHSDFRQQDSEILYSSIGKLVVSMDRKYGHVNRSYTGLEGSITFHEFSETFNKQIKTLNEAAQVDYFWFGMWHLDLNASTSLGFNELVLEHVKEPFISRLKNYLVLNKTLGRDGVRRKLAQNRLNSLKGQMEANKLN